MESSTAIFGLGTDIGVDRQLARFGEALGIQRARTQEAIAAAETHPAPCGSCWAATPIGFVHQALTDRLAGVADQFQTAARADLDRQTS